MLHIDGPRGYRSDKTMHTARTVHTEYYILHTVLSNLDSNTTELNHSDFVKSYIISYCKNQCILFQKG